MVIAGESQLALELEEAAAEAGWAVATPVEAVDGPAPYLILDLTASTHLFGAVVATGGA